MCWNQTRGRPVPLSTKTPISAARPLTSLPSAGSIDDRWASVIPASDQSSSLRLASLQAIFCDIWRAGRWLKTSWWIFTEPLKQLSNPKCGMMSLPAHSQHFCVSAASTLCSAETKPLPLLLLFCLLCVCFWLLLFLLADPSGKENSIFSQALFAVGAHCMIAANIIVTVWYENRSGETGRWNLSSTTPTSSSAPVF